VFGNGTLDLAAHNLNIGSVEGDGLVTLNGHLLRIGDNNLDTTFSGSIQDSGSIAKVGTGSLTLDGVSTYGGSTFVDQGALIVNSQSGSGTSGGPVMVTAGTLGGSGVIQGSVTIGQGNGAGSFLAPSFASTDVARLVIRHALTFKPDGTYICKVGENNVRGDQVQADQVTINTGAQFSLEPFSDQRSPDNTVFMVIDNVSLQPIDGTFANLADGSTITVGENDFLVNYEGGDGNDLTLTVVP
jgi:autotransporter-associated beta strand protein